MQTMEHTLTKPVLFRMTRDLMDHHGLQDWEIRIGSAKRLAGSCNYRKRLITLSYEIHKEWPMDQIRDTILHEIAHALTPRDKGHGKDWKAKCVEIGANPTRCYDSATLPTPEGGWTLSCGECGMDGGTRHRRMRNATWSSCNHVVLYRRTGEPASAAQPYGYPESAKATAYKGSHEWAKGQAKMLGCEVEDGCLTAPKGKVWAMTETHYIDLSLGLYNDYDQSAKEARLALYEDMMQGFTDCGCDYICKDGE